MLTATAAPLAVWPETPVNNVGKNGREMLIELKRSLLCLVKMLQSLYLLLYYYIRRLIKWFLRHTTKLCELQRICYGQPAGAARSRAVEQSLQLSRSPRIKALLVYLDDACQKRLFTQDCSADIVKKAVQTVLEVKRINPRVHPQFVISFKRCVEQIWGYKQLVLDVEDLRTTQYDATDLEHEQKLLELWRVLVPGEELSGRISRQWQDIGFQGDDPKTDFRGMGLLGLDNLCYFAHEYSGPARHVLSHSHHSLYGYTFAIVGINLTSMAYHMLKDGTAKTHIYNIARDVPNINLFHKLYCYLFYEFDKFWIASKPRNIMDFPILQEKFENEVRSQLSDPSTILKINISVDNV